MESERYSRTLKFTATELSLVWKATQEGLLKYKQRIEKLEKREAEGKLEPGEYVPYDTLKIYEEAEKKLYEANIHVEDQVLTDIPLMQEEVEKNTGAGTQ